MNLYSLFRTAGILPAFFFRIAGKMPAVRKAPSAEQPIYPLERGPNLAAPDLDGSGHPSYTDLLVVARLRLGSGGAFRLSRQTGRNAVHLLPESCGFCRMDVATGVRVIGPEGTRTMKHTRSVSRMQQPAVAGIGITTKEGCKEIGNTQIRVECKLVVKSNGEYFPP